MNDSPSMWNSARDFHAENRRALSFCNRCVIEPDELGRSILVCAEDRTLAWSGNSWTPRDRSQAQVSNWPTLTAALTGASEAHLTVTIGSQ